jgi:phosphonate transport system substrate-binding protein
LKVARLASLMAQNAEPFCRALSTLLGVRLVDEVPWQEAEALLHAGEAHVGLVCGLQYVLASELLEVVAAPVMSGPRYGGRPIYYSDVVVRSGHPADSLGDLRGCVWAVNEPTSHSGYNLIRYTLAARGLGSDFFSHVVFSGSHEASLQLLLAGTVDASAIDSTVLEQELHVRPALGDELRVLETLGPSPIPPLVVSRTLLSSERAALVSAVLSMHRSAEGRAVLAAAHIDRFVPACDADYEPIRAMARVADQLAPWPSPPITSPLLTSTAAREQ